jgi:hypothetical protein
MTRRELLALAAAAAATGMLAGIHWLRRRSERRRLPFKRAELALRAEQQIGLMSRGADEMLADSPQIRDYINARLPFMTTRELDDRLLTGSAAGLAGIESTWELA